ncbi:TetR/AcrR family transcriptional regulator [Nonomuraea fuscirosea]|uniref:TetR/AcrR family transcriptional regulator n=1 Tax=Nonomuraea fuscirosea TaxID=1291556 RepID=UPI002DDC669C|nr:TetR/AcrR family transcriptional regulator [Nonomuraea fuscirosea]WSA57405.1 TetR/AcrR family transcriptional regulator [Nonomuraea fuscirosea]
MLPHPADSADSPPRPAADSAGRSTRRRGEALTRAIYRAAFEELARHGYDALAFDKLAPRAGTGKSVLYRRWPGPAELLLDAMNDPVEGFADSPVPDTGTLRGDLLALLGGLARVLDEPRGRAIIPLLTDRGRPPQLHDAVRTLVIVPHQDILIGRLRAAAERGEADPAAVTPLIASVGPRLILTETMQKGHVSEEDVVAVVDDVLLPLTAPRHPAGPNP